ncbi:MAG: RtcB family protein [Solirubrobacteraceae bacterium]
MSDTLRVLVVFALVAGNAFFVIGEYAVVTARRAALAERAERGSERARAALRLMDDPVRVISTVQVGITAIGILVGAIGEPLVRDLLGGGIPSWLGSSSRSRWSRLSVVLGELVPKALTCHGAGRRMSRTGALRHVTGAELRRELAAQGIVVRCPSNRGLAEEAPLAYKDVERVVGVVERAGLAGRVAQLIPLGVVKG